MNNRIVPLAALASAVVGVNAFLAKPMDAKDTIVNPTQSHRQIMAPQNHGLVNKIFNNQLTIKFGGVSNNATVRSSSLW
jgi:hypothetical protein